MDYTQYALKAVYAVAILFAGSFVGSWLTGLVNLTLERSGLDPMVRRLLVSLVRPATFAVAAVAALSLFIDMTSGAAILGAATLAIGMALQGSLSNVASGALLLTLRPFQVDDTITAAGHTGKVQSLKLFATVLHTPDGNTITLPNNTVFTSPITTYTQTPTSRIDLAFTLPPATDAAKAEALVLAALTEDTRTLDDPAPTVVYGEPTDLGIVLVGRAWTDNDARWDAMSDIRRDILARLRKAKITLASRGGA